VLVSLGPAPRHGPRAAPSRGSGFVPWPTAVLTSDDIRLPDSKQEQTYGYSFNSDCGNLAKIDMTVARRLPLKPERSREMQCELVLA